VTQNPDTITRKPRSFRLDHVEKPRKPAADSPKDGPNRRNAAGESPKTRPRSANPAPVLVESDDPFDVSDTDLRDALDRFDEKPSGKPVTPKSRFSFLKWFLIALGALVSLATGLMIDALIRDLFARYTVLGWLGLVLTAVVVITLLAMVVREMWALSRLARIDTLQQRGAKAHETNNDREARAIIAELEKFYQNRPDTARGRARMADHLAEIIDGRDLIALAEKDLLQPLDEAAKTIVMNAAKRVSVVTAISPRAFVDVSYVLWENTKLVRALSQHYGGRPGFFGFFRLSRNVIGHLAVTGSIALGDSLVQQMLGHGLAAKISSRLGEGVVNGLLTARIGIAAIDVCRPLPFVATQRPGVSDFLGQLTSWGGKDADQPQK
jgi:putative membrane protein